MPWGRDLVSVRLAFFCYVYPLCLIDVWGGIVLHGQANAAKGKECLGDEVVAIKVGHQSSRMWSQLQHCHVRSVLADAGMPLPRGPEIVQDAQAERELVVL